MNAIKQYSTRPESVYQREWYAKKVASDPAYRAAHRRACRKYQASNPEKALAQRTKWHRRIRSEVLVFLGDRCVGCGFTNPLALHVDHINDDGYLEKHHRYIGHVHKLITSDPDGARRKYQILCANCNEIKRIMFVRKED